MSPPKKCDLLYREPKRVARTVLPSHRCRLADVLSEAPLLLSMLSSHDVTALAGCSKQSQHLIHSPVHTVIINNMLDIRAVLTGCWPQLAVVKVRSVHLFDRAALFTRPHEPPQ